MPIEEINIGDAPNDGTGDTIRDAFDKTNNNFSIVVYPYLADPAPVTNQVLKWNGDAWVPGDITSTTEFTFACTAFGVTGKSSIELIGTGNWIASGEQAFTASWQLDPDSASVNVNTGGTNFPVAMTSGSGYTASDTNTAIVTYPGAVNGTRVFTITGVKAGSSPATRTFTTTFMNKMYFGLSVLEEPDDSEIRALSNNGWATSLTIAQTVLALDGTARYLHFAWPSRLGTPTTMVNGFSMSGIYPDSPTGSWVEVAPANFDNGTGFLETYRRWRSKRSYKNTTSDTMTFEVL